MLYCTLSGYQSMLLHYTLLEYETMLHTIRVYILQYYTTMLHTVRMYTKCNTIIHYQILVRYASYYVLCYKLSEHTTMLSYYALHNQITLFCLTLSEYTTLCYGISGPLCTVQVELHEAIISLAMIDAMVAP